ncbi:MAG: phosphopantothenoylcysteine decarboxylase [Akkermansiaceae bacterium]|nr:phosphopantothenoylcysteine decarboxylase [Akkermansiaceae bacterium]
MNLLITAGPTREAIDPVRYLTNRSSGKMGYALAEVAARHGHKVLLVSGPTSLDLPPGVDFLPVESAADMFDAVRNQIGKADAAVFAAAVADYRPAAPSAEKIKKTSETMTLELVRNPDILGSARATFHFPGVLVGFAAETDDLEANARAKLEKKGCDLVVANDVSRPGIGFDSDHNEVLLVYPDRLEPLARDTKDRLAHIILDAIVELHASRA